MKPYMTLTRRYVLFLAGVIAVSLIGSIVVTSFVVRSGFSNLFAQRLTRCREVLEQYSQVQYLQTLRKLEAVLTSPRFLAAVATADPGTIQREIPTYSGMLDSDFLLLTDDNNHIIYSSGALKPDLIKKLSTLSEKKSQGIIIDYIPLDGEIVETVCTEIITNDGVSLGLLISGTRLSKTLTSELNKLTGFDIIVSQGEQIIGHNESRLSSLLIENKRFFNPDNLTLQKATKSKLFDEEILYLSLPSPYANATITFAGSLDEHISPIMKQVTLLLIGLSIAGGLAALMAIYAFTERRIGRQVDGLVKAAERIATGEMEFEIIPQSNDELGFLAGEFEQMRSRLVANRLALEKAYQENLMSERMATTGRFTAGIIHDLKNPMAIIRSSTELLQLSLKGNEKIVKHCGNINKQVDRMVNLTRDILEYCHGKTRLELVQVNLKDYFNEILEFHNPYYKRAGISLLTGGEDIIIVNLDPNRFRRVIDNLLNNARDALKPGDKVSIVWNMDKDKLTIAVTDNGPGIPAQIREKLFEPFVTSGKEGGTGLGLAIARKIIEDHGASIKVASAPETGTSFEISLPSQLVEKIDGQIVTVS